MKMSGHQAKRAGAADDVPWGKSPARRMDYRMSTNRKLSKKVTVPCKGGCGAMVETLACVQKQGCYCNDCRERVSKNRSHKYKKEIRSGFSRNSNILAVIVFVPPHYADSIVCGDQMSWDQFIDAYPRHMTRNGKRIGWYDGCIVSKYYLGKLLGTYQVTGGKIEPVEIEAPVVKPISCEATVITGVAHDHLSGPIVGRKVG